MLPGGGERCAARLPSARIESPVTESRGEGVEAAGKTFSGFVFYVWIYLNGETPDSSHPADHWPLATFPFTLPVRFCNLIPSIAFL
jgi:hypothetical protein